MQSFHFDFTLETSFRVTHNGGLVNSSQNAPLQGNEFWTNFADYRNKRATLEIQNIPGKTLEFKWALWEFKWEFRCNPKELNLEQAT